MGVALAETRTYPWYACCKMCEGQEPNTSFHGYSARKQFGTALKEMRRLHAALLVTMPLYIYAGEVLGPTKPRDITKIELLSLVALVALNAWAVLRTYRRRLRPARELLQAGTTDTKAISQWKAANTILLTTCEPIALYGLALRVWGGTLAQVAPFYACASFLLLVFTPRRSHHLPLGGPLR